ncbi:MAG: hypothetical protein M1433_00600 [Candidatus Parvarchaeota archaeon]|nr:hypothetical protein [Candidatus Parvarchaeota archaeon]
MDNPTHIAKKRSQAALDFLLSWGWIIAVVVIVIGVLFELGIFSVPSQSTLINGFSGLKVSQASSNSSLLVIQVRNDFGSGVTINGITAFINGRTFSNLDCQSSQLSPSAESLCRVPIQTPSGSYTLSLVINYSPIGSSEYLTSNGTISGTTYTGSLPLNNQTMVFSERNLPAGTQWSVTIGSDTNTSTVPSSGNGVISFNLPFGTYSYTIGVPSISGCTNLQSSPSAGTISTGSTKIVQFYAPQGCTTTFSESGIPSGYSWDVAYGDYGVKSNSAGNSITFSTPLGAAQMYSNATVLGLNCQSSRVLVSIGSSKTFFYWTCNTTVSNTNLTQYPASTTWSATFSGYNKGSINVGSNILFDNQNVSSISSSYSTSLAGYSCSGSGTALAGSSFTPSWTCKTTLVNTGLSPYSSTWDSSFDGIADNSVSTSNNATFSANSIGKFSYSASINGAVCSSGVPVLAGRNISNISWTCTTVFQQSGIPAPTSAVPSYPNYTWGISSSYFGDHLTTTFTNGITVTTSGPLASYIVTPINAGLTDGQSFASVPYGNTTQANDPATIARGTNGSFSFVTNSSGGPYFVIFSLAAGIFYVDKVFYPSSCSAPVNKNISASVIGLPPAEGGTSAIIVCPDIPAGTKLTIKFHCNDQSIGSHIDYGCYVPVYAYELYSPYYGFASGIQTEYSTGSNTYFNILAPYNSTYLPTNQYVGEFSNAGVGGDNVYSLSPPNSSIAVSVYTIEFSDSTTTVPWAPNNWAHAWNLTYWFPPDAIANVSGYIDAAVAYNPNATYDKPCGYPNGYPGCLAFFFRQNKGVISDGDTYNSIPFLNQSVGNASYYWWYTASSSSNGAVAASGALIVLNDIFTASNIYVLPGTTTPIYYVPKCNPWFGSNPCN